jgi:hypothetical protein
MDKNATNACRYLKFDSLCPTGAVQRFSLMARARLEPSSQPPLAANGSNCRRPWDLCGAQFEMVSPRDCYANPSAESPLPLLETIPSG